MLAGGLKRLLVLALVQKFSPCQVCQVWVSHLFWWCFIIFRWPYHLAAPFVRRHCRCDITSLCELVRRFSLSSCSSEKEKLVSCAIKAGQVALESKGTEAICLLSPPSPNPFRSTTCLKSHKRLAGLVTQLSSRTIDFDSSVS